MYVLHPIEWDSHRVKTGESIFNLTKGYRRKEWRRHVIWLIPKVRGRSVVLFCLRLSQFLVTDTILRSSEEFGYPTRTLHLGPRWIIFGTVEVNRETEETWVHRNRTPVEDVESTSLFIHPPLQRNKNKRIRTTPNLHKVRKSRLTLVRSDFSEPLPGTPSFVLVLHLLSSVLPCVILVLVPRSPPFSDPTDVVSRNLSNPSMSLHPRPVSPRTSYSPLYPWLTFVWSPEVSSPTYWVPPPVPQSDLVPFFSIIEDNIKKN